MEVVSLVGEVLTKPQDVESSIWEHVWLSPIEVLDLKTILHQENDDEMMNTETKQTIDFNELCSRKFQDHLQSATAAVNEPHRGAWKMKSFWKWGLSDPSSSYPPLRDPEWNHMKFWASEMELQFNRHVEPNNLFWSAPSLGKKIDLRFEVSQESPLTVWYLVHLGCRLVQPLFLLVLCLIRSGWSDEPRQRQHGATALRGSNELPDLCRFANQTHQLKASDNVEVNGK